MTAFIIKVDIDIRHGNPLRVQEPLKQQVVLDRVDVGDREAVGHAGAGSRTPARPDTDAHFSGRHDEVLYNEEIPVESHFADNVQFEVDPLTDLFRDVPVPFFRTLIHQVAQVVGLVIKAGRQREIWKQDVPFQHGCDDLVHDLHGMVNRLGHIMKQVVHLRLLLEIEIRALEPEPVLVVDLAVCVYA